MRATPLFCSSSRIQIRITRRQIATFYILDMSSSRTYPTMWDFRELWHARMAYTAIRDGMELERIMAVCPQWLKSREYEFLPTLDTFLSSLPARHLGHCGGAHHRVSILVAKGLSILPILLSGSLGGLLSISSWVLIGAS